MKNKIYLLAVLLALTWLPTASQAAMKDITHSKTEARVTEMKQRVNEIRAMDFSKLNRAESRNIKHELRDMKNELRNSGPYIYISVGALLLIILILILIL